jgi:hypothetical protein
MLDTHVLNREFSVGVGVPLDVRSRWFWRLDGWGRSVADLVVTLNELNELDVGFVSFTEAHTNRVGHGRSARCVCGIRVGQLFSQESRLSPKNQPVRGLLS